MNPRIQRIELAKLHGYKVSRKIGVGIHEVIVTLGDKEVYRGSWRLDRCPELTDAEGFLPNYLEDLNVMHELELTLDFKQRDKYFTILALYVDGVGICPGMATAAQRAEAFLKVMNKWEK